MRAACVALITAVALCARDLAAQPAERVSIEVRVVPGGGVQVHERYDVRDGLGDATFRVLQRPCATVGPVRMERRDGERVLAASERGPWIEFRDTVAARPDASPSPFELHYQVTLRGEDRDVPLVVLSRPIARLVGEREGAVALAVTSIDSGVSVEFPHGRRADAGVWTSRLVAIPSFVRLSRATPSDATPCEAGPRAGRNDGGLTWRFWTLVGIMVLWVPLYLAWARRSEEGPA